MTKPGYESLSPSKTKSRIASSIAALGIAAAGAAGFESSAKAETAVSSNPVIFQTEAHLKSVTEEIKQLITEKNPHSYKDSLKIAGQKVTRLVVSLKESKKIASYTVYDQVIEYFNPGEKMPYQTEVILASIDKKFSKTEPFLQRESLIRTGIHPKTYIWAKDIPDALGYIKNVEQLVITEIDPINSQTQLDSQILDDFTLMAKTLVDQASGGIPA